MKKFKLPDSQFSVRFIVGFLLGVLAFTIVLHLLARAL